MSIDESAGVRDRKDAVMKSAEMSRTMAIMLFRGNTKGLSFRANTVKAVIRRGWVEERPWPEDGHPWNFRYCLTPAGRMAAEASPAVREWIEGWESGR